MVMKVMVNDYNEDEHTAHTACLSFSNSLNVSTSSRFSSYTCAYLYVYTIYIYIRASISPVLKLGCEHLRSVACAQLSFGRSLDIHTNAAPDLTKIKRHR